MLIPLVLFSCSGGSATAEIGVVRADLLGTWQGSIRPAFSGANLPATLSLRRAPFGDRFAATAEWTGSTCAGSEVGEAWIDGADLLFQGTRTEMVLAGGAAVPATGLVGEYQCPGVRNGQCFDSRGDATFARSGIPTVPVRPTDFYGTWVGTIEVDGSSLVVDATMQVVRPVASTNDVFVVTYSGGGCSGTVSGQARLSGLSASLESAYAPMSLRILSELYASGRYTNARPADNPCLGASGSIRLRKTSSLPARVAEVHTGGGWTIILDRR